MKIKKTAGAFLAFVGVLMMLAGGWYALSNINEDRSAGEQSEEILERIQAQLPGMSIPEGESANELIVGDDGIASGGAASSSSSSSSGGIDIDTPSINIPTFMLQPHAEMPVVTVDGNNYIGILVIPAIGLELPIMNICTNASINIAPGCYHGSAYEGAFVIGGHNYITHFGNLRSLREGDEVRFIDLDGNVFTYQVFGSELLGTFDSKILNSDEWDLSLFTCTLTGSQRLTIRCVKKA